MMKMQPTYLIALVLLILVSCSKDIPGPVVDTNGLSGDQAALKEQIDLHIVNTVRDSKMAFNWNNADDQLLYDALTVSEGVLIVGYRMGDENGRTSKNEILDIVYDSEGIARGAADNDERVLRYENEVLGTMHVAVSDLETIKRIREHESTLFVEVRGYPFDLSLVFKDPPADSDDGFGSTQNLRTMVLDPLSEVPYPDQVAAFDGGLRTVMRRHNMETAYEDHDIFGDDIGLAVVDNGLLPERTDFFYDNGYGDRYQSGYYNPLWFFPWTNPDGVVPRPTDVFGISQLFYSTYYNHGSEMIKMALTLAPNANIHAVRGSTWTVIVTPGQAIGIANAIIAMADDPTVDVISMSMGTIIQYNEIISAIDYFYSKGKVFCVSAGSTAVIINELLGVLFPGNLPTTVTSTALQNRENTDGEFIVGEGSHGGPENDFAIENTSSSSVACSRSAGMVTLVWSANPSMTREELMDVLIQASYFYQELGEKHPFFGWGPVDVGLAVELAMGV